MLKEEELEAKTLGIRKCAASCIMNKFDCPEVECRMWINYEEDHNCTLIAVKKHGPMTLQEISERHGISIVRAKQILDATLVKLKKRLKRSETI